MELELGPGEAVADWPLPRAEADETAVARPRATGSVTGRASRTQASGGSLLGDDRGSRARNTFSQNPDLHSAFYLNVLYTMYEYPFVLSLRSRRTSRATTKPFLPGEAARLRLSDRQTMISVSYLSLRSRSRLHISHRHRNLQKLVDEERY